MSSILNDIDKTINTADINLLRNDLEQYIKYADDRHERVVSYLQNQIIELREQLSAKNCEIVVEATKHKETLELMLSLTEVIRDIFMDIRIDLIKNESADTTISNAAPILHIDAEKIITIQNIYNHINNELSIVNTDIDEMRAKGYVCY